MQKLLTIERSKKYPVIGFLLMLIGSLLVTKIIPFLLWHFPDFTIPELLAIIIIAICFFSPGFSAAISAIYLVTNKEKNDLRQALAILTIAVCNPIFYIIYFFICFFMKDYLAGFA